MEELMQPEAWLRGPVEGVLPELMPAAHMLIQSSEELTAAAQGLSPSELWVKPGGAASVGYHLRHIAGALDRLLTYARGSLLDDAQRTALAAEKQDLPDYSVTTMIEGVQVAVERALATLRSTTRDQLFEPRGVGKAQVPSNVIGLLYHVAEHTVRHTGQVIVTARVVRSSRT
jgi:uncharacterized damage-inducible protein DinB